MQIRCIAVDDDATCLDSLKDYVNKIPDIKLLHTFTNPIEALNTILDEEKLDIVFLDIEMPAISGLDLALRLRSKTKYLVFTTAHTQYAVEAFQVDADAYLLKPYSLLHLAKTINNLYPLGNLTEEKISLIDDNFFYVPTQGDLVRIDVNDLISLEELNDDIKFTTISNTYLSARSNFIKTLKILKQHEDFILPANHTILAKQHIKKVTGNQVLVSNDNIFTVENAFQAQFDFFVKNYLHQN